MVDLEVLAGVACLTFPVWMVHAVCWADPVTGEDVVCQIYRWEEMDAVCSSLEARVVAAWIFPVGGEGEACLIFPEVEVGVVFQIGHEMGGAC